MIRSIARSAALGLTLLGATLGAQAASATTFAYDFKSVGNKSAGSYSALTFSDKVDGTTLNLSVYGGHASGNTQTSSASVSAATVATWSGYGMGVLYGSDSTYNGTHQIDNVGNGVDFVALVFDQAVTLTSIGRTAYGITGYGTDSDASFWAADSSNWMSSLNETLFTPLASGTSSTGSKAASKIWLVSASTLTGDRDDGFKLTGVSVSTAAVPEPASWAMMVGGFGALGGVMRRRKDSALVTA